ncbi:hypothetical protein T484DRAFT_1900345 [Baffinella frigidus]|nr:hypothetical protein T484DRAFT_1900345 [Cryptophyta sp. CCMP2293]
MHSSQLPRQQKLLDLKLEMDMRDVQLLDYHRKQEVVERGYVYAKEKLRAYVHKLHQAEAKKTETHPETTQAGMASKKSSMPIMALTRQECLLWEPPALQQEQGEQKHSVSHLGGQSELSFRKSFKDPKDVFAETFARVPVKRAASVQGPQGPIKGLARE